ncbi:hypothetical protein [Sphingobium cupriresistens]|uniref:hypothetical protein n=1 Tax=Sphingobium cupriresistens TaxID=1132417 RepID=UPI003BF4F553
MSTLSPDQTKRLEYWRGKLRNEWRIADECGPPRTEAGKVWDMVQLEMKFYCPDFMLGMTIASYASQWVETRNPHFIDGAVYLCSLSAIAPPPAVAELVAEVARLRFLGDVRGGTPEQIDREAAKNQTLTLMANLRAAGASLEVAASKASKFLSDHYEGRALKASSLQKFYTGEWRRLEIVLRDNMRLDDDGADRLAQWQQILAALPEADDDLRGNRRD